MFLIDRLHGPEFDFPAPWDEPKFTYMIATTPRSGSTLFCTHLWRTGQLGAPMEYTNIRQRQWVVKNLGGDDLSKYWREIRRRRTSPNGVFGFKCFTPDLEHIASACPELLAEIHSDAVIFLRRRDRVAQAVSYARALTTEVWFSDVPEPLVEYDHKAISDAEYWIARQEAQWEILFAKTDAKPIVVYYEDFLKDPAATIADIAGRMGIPFDPAAPQLPIPGFEKQASGLSKDWIARYRAEREPDPHWNATIHELRVDAARSSGGVFGGQAQNKGAGHEARIS